MISVSIHMEWRCAALHLTLTVQALHFNFLSRWPSLQSSPEGMYAVTDLREPNEKPNGILNLAGELFA